MKALITGSGGLIGSECARILCREGWEVVGSAQSKPPVTKHCCSRCAWLAIVLSSACLNPMSRTSTA